MNYCYFLLFNMINDNFSLHYSYDPELQQLIANENLDHEKLRQIIALSVLDDEELRNHLTNFDIDDISDVQGWIDNHTRPGYWCDYSFLLAAANYLKRDLVILPIDPKDGHGGTGFIRITPRETSGDPFYFLYYVGVHYQSIIPVPN